MRYYKHLYLTEGLKRKKRKSSASWNPKLQPSVHVITLAVSREKPTRDLSDDSV